MNSDDLVLFAQVAKSGGISRTALLLGTDQSTVSRRIALLETELGVRLFQRTGRGMALTERGQELLTYASGIVSLLTEAEGAMRQSAQQGPARICIAAQPTIARMLFAETGKALRKAYPHSQIRFIEGLASQILVQLADGEADLSILYMPAHPGTLKFDRLFTETLHLITPPDFAHEGEHFNVIRLGEIPLILPSTQHGLRILVEELAARYGFRLNIVLECDGSTALTKHLVAEGNGCTVLPPAAVREAVAQGRLRSVRLVPEVIREIGLVWPKNREKPQGFYAVTQILRQQIEAIISAGAWPEAQLLAPPVRRDEQGGN